MTYNYKRASNTSSTLYNIPYYSYIDFSYYAATTAVVYRYAHYAVKLNIPKPLGCGARAVLYIAGVIVSVVAMVSLDSSWLHYYDQKSITYSEESIAQARYFTAYNMYTKKATIIFLSTQLLLGSVLGFIKNEVAKIVIVLFLGWSFYNSMFKSPSVKSDYENAIRDRALYDINVLALTCLDAIAGLRLVQILTLYNVDKRDIVTFTALFIFYNYIAENTILSLSDSKPLHPPIDMLYHIATIATPLLLCKGEAETFTKTFAIVIATITPTFFLDFCLSHYDSTTYSEKSMKQTRHVTSYNIGRRRFVGNIIATALVIYKASWEYSLLVYPSLVVIWEYYDCLLIPVQQKSPHDNSVAEGYWDAKVSTFNVFMFFVSLIIGGAGTIPGLDKFCSESSLGLLSLLFVAFNPLLSSIFHSYNTEWHINMVNTTLPGNLTGPEDSELITRNTNLSHSLTVIESSDLNTSHIAKNTIEHIPVEDSTIENNNNNSICMGSFDLNSGSHVLWLEICPFLD